MGRFGRLPVAAFGVVIGAWLLAAAPTAEAVFPGAKGRVLFGGMYAPPDPTPISLGGHHGGFRFSPGGVMVAGTKAVGGNLNMMAVWVSNSDGTDYREIIQPVGISDEYRHPTWSPDGTELLIARKHHPCGECPYYPSIERVDVATGAHAPVLQPAGGQAVYRYPEWSPDGTQALVGAFESDGADQWYGITAVNLATGASTRIKPLEYFEIARYSPDMTKLVAGGYNGYSSGETEYSEVRVVERGNPSNTLLSFLINQSYDHALPTWTPDGGAISWGDCRPNCGLWTRPVPEPGQPAGAEVLELADNFTEKPVDWEPLVAAPLITKGPLGKVATRNATFEFASASGASGGYECRLVELGTAFADCESPQVYNGLEDGEHTFEVRAKDPTDPEGGPSASRKWTSDTTPPTAVFDQVPVGTVERSEATLAFHSIDADGIAFLCSLDGEPQRECSSPERVTSLDEGAHSFAVWAFDDVGNVQETPAVVTWSVKFPANPGGGGGGTTPPAPGTPATPPEPPDTLDAGCMETKVTAGPVTALARTGCFKKTREKDDDVYRTTGKVMVNGMLITPQAGTTIVLRPALSDVEIGWTGPASLTWGSIGPWPVLKDTIKLSRLAALSKLRSPAMRVAGLEVAEEPKFELSSEDGGTMRVTLQLKLPPSVRGINDGGMATNENLGGLTFEFTFQASNEKAVRYTGKAQIDTAYLFGVKKLTDLSIGLDSGPPASFEVSAALTWKEEEIGTIVKRQEKVAVTLAISEKGGPWGKLRKVGVAVSGLQKPIATGVYLQRFGGEATPCDAGGILAAKVKANAGISILPAIKFARFEGEIVSLNGEAELSLCEPKHFSIEGTGKLVDFEIAKGKVHYPFGKVPELSGLIEFTPLDGYGVKAEMKDSFFDMRSGAFNVRATGEVKLPSFASVLNGLGEVVVSSNGYAVCTGKPERRVGFGRHWGTKRQDFTEACDVGPFTEKPAAARASAAAKATASQLTGAPAFSIKSATKVAVVELKGAGGPPKVTLAGPGARSVIVPAGPEGLQTDEALVVQDAGAQTTYVVLYDPPAGDWSVTPSGIGPGLTSTRVALGLPPVAIRAASKKARNGKRTLTWSSRAPQGQQIEFVEIGESTVRRLATTARARGRITYRPAVGQGRSRRIEAIVSQNGLPRERKVVARYRVPPIRTKRPGRARRQGSSLVWRQPGKVSGFSVLLTSDNGRTRPIDTRRAKVKIPRGWPRRRLTVMVAPIGIDGEPGRVRTTVLKK